MENEMFLFFMLYPSSHSICSLGLPFDVSYFSLSSFYFGPSVINFNSCFFSPWRGTFHKIENHSTCLPHPCPFCISVVGLIMSSTCSGINSHCKQFPESLSFKNHSGLHKGKPFKKLMSCFREAICMVVKQMDRGGWLLDSYPDPIPSYVNFNKLLQFSLPLFLYL